MPSVWPFVPEIGATETYQYNTEVLKSYTKEQRIRLRDKPRYILNYTHFLDDNQLALAKLIAKTENQTGSYKVPVWPENFPYMGTISSSATSIAVNTSTYKFTGTEVMLWKSWDNYVVCTISSQTPSQLNLTAAVGTTLVDPLIVPLKTMRALSGIEVSTGAPNINYVSVEFTSLDHKNYVKIREDIFDTSDIFVVDDIFAHPFPKYLGKVSFTSPPYRFRDLSSIIIRPAEYIDNGFGQIAVEPTSANVEDRFVMDFFYQGNTQRVDTLGFLCQFYGRNKSFWLPSFTQDVILQSGTFSSTSLTVAAIGSTTSYIGKNIFIRQRDGSYQFNTITNAVLSGGNYVLTLQNALSSPVSTTLTESISFMRLSRFDTDSIQVEMGAASSGKITVNSIEVPN